MGKRDLALLPEESIGLHPEQVIAPDDHLRVLGVLEPPDGRVLLLLVPDQKGFRDDNLQLAVSLQIPVDGVGFDIAIVFVPAGYEVEHAAVVHVHDGTDQPVRRHERATFVVVDRKNLRVLG